MNNKKQNSFDFTNGKTQNENGFSIPENYFDTVEDAVFSKIGEQHFPVGNAFSTPDRYFESFEDTLFSKLDITKKEVKVISLKSRVLKFIPTAAAASVLLFIGLNIFTTEDPFNTISSEDLDSWFDENYIDYSTVNAIEFIDTDFTERNILEDDTSIDDDDILEYLNTIDSSSLLTEIES